MQYQEQNAWGDGMLQGALIYGKKPMLEYRIAYPRPTEKIMPGCARQMSAYYRQRAQNKLETVKQQIYPQAVQAYLRLGKTEDFKTPRLMEEFTPMYCSGGLRSIFFDTYLIGCTGRQKITRAAQTFDLWKKQFLTLPMFFARGFSYRDVILAEAARQLDRQSREEGSLYYRNAEKLLKTQFSEQNYYLADDGVVIFYGQRALGKSALGVPSFLIPYELFGSALKPEL